MKWIGSTAPSSPAGLKRIPSTLPATRPRQPGLFYCGRIPVSEHPAESNIRGAAIIDKNGCLVAEPADKTVERTRMCALSIFFFFLSFSSRSTRRRACDVPAVRRYAELFTDHGCLRRRDEMNRQISDERTSRRREFTGVFRSYCRGTSALSNSVPSDSNRRLNIYLKLHTSKKFADYTYEILVLRGSLYFKFLTNTDI